MKWKQMLSLLCCMAVLVGTTACSNDKKTTTSKKEPSNKQEQSEDYVFVSEGNSASRLNPQTGGADKEADAMRESIMNAKDALDTKNGTVYYISSVNGDDKNDGTTPEKAWATLKAYSKNKWNFKEGDTILFERGGIYRGDNLSLISGMNYGAYGTGAKPALYGSKMNYVGEGMWKETDKENVWVCGEYIVSDCGVIVFNHGQAVGVKRLKDGDDLESNLATLEKNFEFYHDMDNAKLYLYMDCDPSENFYDIEICEKGSILKGSSGTENVTIDNLTLKYSGAYAMRFDDDAKNITITNCEMGFIGGSLQQGTIRYGNAVEFWNGCSNILAENNWIYQVYDAGFTHQGGDIGGYVQEDITFRNNLVEYCSFAIEFWAGDPAHDVLRNITYENNMFRFSGYGWGVVRPDPLAVSAINTWGHTDVFQTENFVIQNNVFDMSAKSVIVSWYQTPLDITYTGNTYYLKEGRVAIWSQQEYLNAGNQQEMENSVAVFEKNPKLVQFIAE